MAGDQNAPDAVERKIPDEQLRALARARSTEPVSVIVELNVPRPEVEIADERQAVGAWRPSRVRAPSESELELHREITHAAYLLLERLSSGTPVSVSDGAFGVLLPSGALDLVAASPLVRRIYASRLRR